MIGHDEDCPVSIRLPTDLKAWIVSRASEQGRSMNRQIVQVLKEAMKAEEQGAG